MRNKIKYYLLFVLFISLCFTGKALADSTATILKRDEFFGGTVPEISNIPYMQYNSYRFVSSDETVLTVKSSGYDKNVCDESFCTVAFRYTIDPKKSGDASVSLYDENGVLRWESNYHVVSPVTGITTDDDKTEFVMAKGDVYSLPSSLGLRTIPVDADNTKIIYSVQDTDIATIDENGNVTAHNVGWTYITATTEDGGFEKKLDLEVVVPAETVTIVGGNRTYTSKASVTGYLSATVTPDTATYGAGAIKWTSSNPSIIAVDNNGVLTIKGNGQVTITACAKHPSTLCDSITVTASNIITDMHFSEERYTLSGIGATKNLSFEHNEIDNLSTKGIRWVSSNESVATVDSNGKVTSVGYGTATITAYCDEDDISASVEVNVVKEITSVTLSEESLELNVGESFTLEATVSPSDAVGDKTLTWTSSNPTVATVDDEGTVTAHKSGSATISVVTPNGKSDSLIVNVVVGAIPVYRMYNPLNGEHLYTTDAHEVEVLYTKHGWGFEGIGWYSASSGTPVYRLYNAGLANHLYTSDAHEIEVLTENFGWVLDNDGEPVMYSVDDSGIPIFRVYNEALRGLHHLTTDENEYDVLPQHGWEQEGISMYALSDGVPIITYYYINSKKQINFDDITANVLN